MCDSVLSFDNIAEIDEEEEEEKGKQLASVLPRCIRHHRRAVKRIEQ